MNIIIFLSLLFFSHVALSNAASSPVDDATLSHLSNSEEWHRLLNYKKTIFGGYNSEADGKDFFLSPDGKTNPEAELKTLVFELMSRKAISNDHARCRFPARSTFISQKLNLPLAKEELCTEFKKFEASFDAESISLVFSAYYINNPSSTFGHTFLRVKKKDSLQNTELLDLGVNFAANPWTENPLLYSIGGLSGWFDGVFSTLPYYYKVREYNDFESRDLWSYELNLTQSEIDQLMRHLWELGQTKYDYYFFTENCSYHIFTAIEAAAPRLNLSQKLPYWVIPSDTVQALSKEKDLIKDVSYRPSIRNIFVTRFNTLNTIEQNEFILLRDSRSLKISEKLSPESKVKIIDTLIDWIEYKYSKDLRNEKSEEFRWKNSLLMERVKAPPMTNDIVPPEPLSKPHISHGSQRFSLETGYSEQFKDFQRYHLRFALHDLLDPDYGYPENVQIEFFNIQLQSHDEFKKWDLYDWTVISVKSLAPFEKFEKKPSWELLFGMKSYQDDQCGFCQAGYFHSGLGVSLDIAKKLTFYTLGQLEVSFSEKFKDDTVRSQIGPKLGFLYKPQVDLKFQLEGVWYWDPFQEYDSYESEFSVRKGFSTKKDHQYGLGASAKMKNDITEGSLQFFYYH